MAPKKKGNNKADDDWENELGEAPDSVAVAETATEEDEVAKGPDNGGMGGGLLAALHKNRTKKAKKGKPIQEDFVEGEDPTATENGDPGDAIATKAPEEATTDDLFGPASAKGKGGKGKLNKTAEKEDEDEEDAGEEGGMKSKKEKEKEKKERERLRKKENVRILCDSSIDT